IVIAAFIPALDNGFVEWDDLGNFLHNPYYRGLGAAQVKWAWSTFWVGVYQPLAWLLFEAQYVLWKFDPRGYHLTSLLLHTANAVVLYVLTVTLLVRWRPDSFLKSPWTCSLGAGLATALFMVHPLRVEAVAWASCQPYLPCALFSMLAVLAYLRAFGMGPSPQWGWLVVSFLLFVAALLSKAVAVTLPAVLLLLDLYPLRRLGDGPGRWFGSAARKVWCEKVPFVIMSLVFMGLAIAARKHDHTVIPTQDYGTSARIAQACYGIWFYIVKTLLPLDITALYPLPGRIDWSAPPFLLSILGTLAISVGLFLLRRRRPGLLVAWLSYLVILAPNLGFIRVGNQLAADRYSYMAMLGGVMLAAAGLCRLWQSFLGARPGAIGIITVSLGALLGLVLLTWHQCRTWRTSETLWTHALNHGAGRSIEAHNNLGLVLFRQGKFVEAAAHYNEAIRLNPGYAGAHNNLGVVLFQQGKFAEAAAHYNEAIRVDPDYAAPHNNLGLVQFRQGKFVEAAAHYNEAIRL
ncbi:MAG: tetratricopeptide repeat protein, partial [Isosphaeraceae bacterium]